MLLNLFFRPKLVYGYFLLLSFFAIRSSERDIRSFTRFSKASVGVQLEGYFVETKINLDHIGDRKQLVRAIYKGLGIKEKKGARLIGIKYIDGRPLLFWNINRREIDNCIKADLMSKKCYLVEL